MAWNLTDTDEVWMNLDNGFYSVDIPKFRYQVVIDGDFATIYWTDSESSGEAGIRRQTPTIDYHDFEVGGVPVSSAAEIETGLLNYRNSAFGGGGGVQSVTGLNTDNTDPLNPIVQISVDGATITGDGTSGNPLVATPGTSVAWGSITGTLSDQTDLQSALDAKQATLVSGTNIKSVNSNSLLGSGDLVLPRFLNVQYTVYTLQNGQTRYFGVNPKAPSTVGENKIYFRTACTIMEAEIFQWANTTAGTNENISIYIRLNNTTDYLIATVGLAAAERVFSNTSLNSGSGIAIVNGDYIEFKMVMPTFATPPAGTTAGGYLTIK